MKNENKNFLNLLLTNKKRYDIIITVENKNKLFNMKGVIIMTVRIIDHINGNVRLYSGIKTIRYRGAYYSLVFYDGKIINFHNLIYTIDYYDDGDE